MQKSVIYKTLIIDGAVSLAVLDTTALVGELVERHGLSPVAAAALGRTMTATAYLCSWLKDEKATLSVTVNGGGVGGKICTAGDGSLRLRGFAGDPCADLPPKPNGKLDVGGYVGHTGTLTVAIDRGEGIPYVGSSELVSGEIAEDFSAYFLTSEQRPTAIALGVKIAPDGTCAGAGGVFLQPLPGADDGLLKEIENLIGNYSEISSRIEADGALAVLEELAPGLPYEEREISFRCTCSREKAEGLIVSLGKEEAAAILAEQGEISVLCHYCNTAYRFGKEETMRLFGEDQ